MTQTDATLAAVLTPVAPGAIAVIAIGGAGVDRAVATVCRTRGGASVDRLEVDRPRLVRIHDAAGALDDAIVARFEAGGQSRAELCVHGGVRIVHRVLAVLASAGATVVSAEAFEDRFGRAGGAVVRDVDKTLIDAGSRRVAMWLLAQRRLLPAFLANWSERRPAEIEAFRERSEAAIRLVRGIRVALVGPPNAGKSTLANRLIGHGRVIVSDEAGTTRDWVDETAMIDGWPVTLTDTAGVRETQCAIEQEAIRRGTERARDSDLVLVLADATVPCEMRRKSIEATIGAVQSAAPRLIVLNKSDVATEIEEAVDVDAIQDRDVVAVSALTGAGCDALERRMAEALGLDKLDTSLATGLFPAHLDGRASSSSERMWS